LRSFDFRPNTCHKGKGNGVGNRGEGKQVTTVGVSNKGDSESGVDSRAKEGKG